MPIAIDGSLGEGGGQILRTSLGLSSLTGRPIKVFNIRAGRPNPGLRAQHLVSIRAMREITGGRLIGDEIGSKVVEFIPDGVMPGNYKFDIGTAGSVTLLTHSLLPPLLSCDGSSDVTVRGGTDVRWSPTVSYYKNVTLVALGKMGIEASIDIVRRGYFPKGGGEISIHIKPWKKRKGLGSVKLRPPKRIFIESCAHGLGRDVIEDQVNAAIKELEGFNIELLHDDSGSIGRGNAVTIWAMAGDMPIGHSVLGSKGLSPNSVGEEAGRVFKSLIQTGRCDKYLPDQLIPFVFLADGNSSVPLSEVTGHLKTNLDICGRFIDLNYSIENECLKVK